MILKAQIWLTSFGEMSLRFVAKKKKKKTNPQNNLGVKMWSRWKSKNN